MTKYSYEERMQLWQRNRFAPPPAPDAKPTVPNIVVKMPMRDGIGLYTEIFLPFFDNASKSYPVILLRSPYPFTLPSLNDRRPLIRYLERGYAIVFQIIRGLGDSEGVYRFFRNDLNDGYDCIEWIATQRWCNGRVGMEGSSYLGGTQLLAARTKPRALKCIIPSAFVGNFTQCYPFSYGVPSKGPYLQWHQLLDVDSPDKLEVGYGDMNALNHPSWGEAFRCRPLINAADNILIGDIKDGWQETIASPLDDGFWSSLHFTDNELADLDIPIFFIDAWYDETIGPIDFFTRLEKMQPQRNDRFLLVGPWNHVQTYADTQEGEDDGERILPDGGSMDMVSMRLDFFDRYLKDEKIRKNREQEEAFQLERVRVYITGSDNSTANRWLNLPTFPAPDTEQRCLYLHSQGDARTFPGDGVLNWEAPGEEPEDHFSYDPALPTSFVGESPKDRRDIEIRSDVLTFTSEPLTECLTILGEIILILYAASDAPDTDWITAITEISPDGQSKSFHYAPNAYRARYRMGTDKELLLTPNQPEKYRIPMGPAGHQISEGHRLRLSIFCSAFPAYEPNSNTGNAVAMDTDNCIAKQTIFHDGMRPSHIVLPVIDLGHR